MRRYLGELIVLDGQKMLGLASKALLCSRRQVDLGMSVDTVHSRMHQDVLPMFSFCVDRQTNVRYLCDRSGCMNLHTNGTPTNIQHAGSETFAQNIVGERFCTDLGYLSQG